MTMPKPITVLELAEYRGVKVKDSVSMAEVEAVGLPFMGGCKRCQDCVACYNSCPTRTGFLMCEGCVGPDGFETVEEANKFLFPEEYRWFGPNNTNVILDN
jgi:hypothetical protein